MAYWLFKSEPECFSFADLEAAPDRTTGWDGVRNYQARNFLRDQVRRGDWGPLRVTRAAEPPAIAGVAEVVVEAHLDPTAFDPAADHHDPKKWTVPRTPPGFRSPSARCDRSTHRSCWPNLGKVLPARPDGVARQGEPLPRSSR
ncbi:MAG: EVE domain-containing protein [Isosphaeraceae bacterium]